MSRKINKEVMYLEIEKSRIKREKSRIVLNKSLFLYFAFLIIGAMGFSFQYLDATVLNALVIAGIIILIVGTIPYLVVVANEEKKINEMIAQLK